MWVDASGEQAPEVSCPRMLTVMKDQVMCPTTNVNGCIIMRQDYLLTMSGAVCTFLLYASFDMDRGIL